MIKFLFSLLLLGVAGTVFFQFTDPLLETIGELRTEKARLETGLANAAKLREVQQALLDTYNSLSPADLAKLQKLLPDSVDLVRLIIDVNTIAERSGMTIKNIRVQSPKELEGETPTAAARSQFSKEPTTFGFSVSGPYLNFQSFVSDLAKSLRLIDVVSASFASDESGIYEYNVEVQTYWLK